MTPGPGAGAASANLNAANSSAKKKQFYMRKNVESTQSIPQGKSVGDGAAGRSMMDSNNDAASIAERLREFHAANQQQMSGDGAGAGGA